MKNVIILFALSLALFQSCCKPDPEPTTEAMARDKLYNLMNRWYFWYDKMPAVNKEDYSDPYELLEALRYGELDKGSVVVDYQDHLAQMQGTSVTHGIQMALDESQKARIAMIYRESPLYIAGVRRGWIVKTINGQDIADILIRNDTKKLAEVVGPHEEGVKNVFVFSPPGQSDVTITSTKIPFTVNTVLLFDTIHLSNGSIAGHLVLSFLGGTTSNELKPAFEFFKSNSEYRRSC